MVSVIFTLLNNKISAQTIQKSALKYGFVTMMEKSEIFSLNEELLEAWLTQFSKNDVKFQYTSILIEPRCKINKIQSADLSVRVARSWFTVAEIAKIYKIPTPIDTPITVGVVSFGGGLYGNISNTGVLTGGDVQAYWSSIGISLANQPTVIVIPINGARNNLADTVSTAENTLDVEAIGGCCPSSKLTIILYISPNSLAGLYNVFNYIINTPVIVSGISYKPSIISCSWGLPELYVPKTILNSINTLLSLATESGINICTASGDFGSNNGVGGSSTNADFPSSSPYVTAVGGTTLVCPNYIYDSSTIETAWSSGGGAPSKYFAKPSYQSDLTGTGRLVPDIALIADPNTGVQFILNGKTVVYGGTSVGAPICAGFLATIHANNFINPIIYSNTNAFNDILTGSNGAFTATQAFDLCTGHGSIKGDILSTLINPSLSVVLATDVTIITSVLSLYVSQVAKLLATVYPQNTSNKALAWVSSDESKVTVVNGTITALAVTNTPVFITATTTDGSLKSFSVTINITAKISVLSVGLSQTRVTLNKDSTIQLSAIFTPTNVSNTAVVWSTNNSNVSVSSNGLVTGILPGNSIVTITTNDGAKRATCAITVVIPVVSVSVIPTTLALRINSPRTIVASILPSSATNKTVTWVSSNPLIATVGAGRVVGKKVGTAIITVTTADGGKIATTLVTVT